MRIFTVLAVASASVSTVATAQTERDLDSHVHGAASMNVAVDTDALFLELDSPWNNLVGFEHAPSTDEQKTLVNEALLLLNQPEQLFTFEGTNCTVTETAMENGLAHDDHHDEDAHGHDDHDDEHGHDDHDDEHSHDDHDDEKASDKHGHDDHDDEHGHDDHHDEKASEEHSHDDHDDDEKTADGHDHDHDDHDDEHADSEDGEHSSILVSYQFSCDNISQLSAIDVNLLNVWSNFEDLDVQLVGPGGQAAIELGQQNTRMDISQVQ